VSGNTLTASFGLSFLPGFAGPKTTYLLVSGSAGSTGWQPEGSWTPVVAPVPPTNVNVVPSSGSGSNQKFTAIYVDAQGYQDISEASFMMANDVSGVGGCIARWVPRSNLLYLGNDAATVWLGPIQGGSGATLQNSQCVLSAATSSWGVSGNTLTASFGLSFLPGFAGPKTTYLLVSGSAGSTGWQPEGSWIP
jgi:hypothetical protein